MTPDAVVSFDQNMAVLSDGRKLVFDPSPGFPRCTDCVAGGAIICGVPELPCFGAERLDKRKGMWRLAPTKRVWRK